MARGECDLVVVGAEMAAFAAIHPHPTIPEVVKAAAKGLVEGPGRLSCCEKRRRPAELPS